MRKLFSNAKRFWRNLLCMLCVTAIIIASIPLREHLISKAEDSVPDRQVQNFEDDTLFSIPEGDTLQIDGLQDGKGYLYGSNLSDSAQYIDLGKNELNLEIGKTYNVSFDLLTVEMPASSKIFTAAVTNGNSNAVYKEFKQAYYEEVEHWYHFDANFAPETANSWLRLTLSAGALVLFDNIVITDEAGNAVEMDVETAAENAYWFDWVFNDNSVSVRMENPVFHINNPSGSVTRRFSIGTELNSHQTVNAKYTLKFDYYYTDNGSSDASTEKIGVRLANNNTSTTGSLNATLDLAENQPKFNAWHSFESEFTAKNRNSTMLTFEVASGIDIMIDNIDVIDANGNSIWSLDFSEDNISTAVNPNTEEQIAVIEDNIAVKHVSDWSLSLNNASTASVTTNIKEHSLTTVLDRTKQYYLRMKAFIARDAKDSTNFDLMLGRTKIVSVEKGDITVDSWQTYTSGNFRPTSQYLSFVSYPGLIAYFDDIEVIDASTNEVELTYTIKNVEDSTAAAVGGMVDRDSIRAGSVKNTVLHINTPISSKNRDITNVALEELSALKALVPGSKYKMVADVYYSDNGYANNWEEMGNNMPNIDIGSTKVFSKFRSDYMKKDGRYYNQWFSLETDVFTASASMTSISFKAWSGTDMYYDNITFIDNATGKAVATIDFEDNPSYRTWNESQAGSPAAPKGYFTIESGPDVEFVENVLKIENNYGETPTYLEDYDMHFLEVGKSYHIEADAYIEKISEEGQSFTFGFMSDSIGNVGGFTVDDPIKKWYTAVTRSFSIKEKDDTHWMSIISANGFIGYFDNVKVIDDATNEVLRTFTMGAIDNATNNSNHEIVGEIVDGNKIGKTSTEYSLYASGETVRIFDKQLERLVSGYEYRIEYYYWLETLASSSLALEASLTDSSVSGNKGVKSVFCGDDNRGLERWEKASAVGTLNGNVDSITVTAAEGTALYIDDIVITDALTNEIAAVISFDASSDIRTLDGNTASTVSSTPNKKNIFEVAPPVSVMAGYLRAVAGNTSSIGKIGATNGNLRILSDNKYTVSFSYYQAKSATDGDTLFTVDIEPSVLKVGSQLELPVILNNQSDAWQELSFTFETGDAADIDWLHFVLGANASVYIDNLIVTRYVEDLNKEIAVLDFETDDSEQFFTKDSDAYRIDAEKAEELGFATNGSNGYLYINNSKGGAPKYYPLKDIKLKSNTNYAVRFEYSSAKDWGDGTFAAAFGYRQVTAEDIKSYEQFYDSNVVKGWNNYTMYFRTGEVVPNADYFTLIVYNGMDFIFDNIAFTEVPAIETQSSVTLDFEERNDVFYPDSKEFTWVTDAELKELHPNNASVGNGSNGYLRGYSSKAREDKAHNYFIRGIALRSNMLYTVSIDYQVLTADTNTDDSSIYDLYFSLGDNGGTDSTSYSYHGGDSNISDNAWRTLEFEFETGEVVDNEAYLRISLYYGCEVLFDNLTVTENIPVYAESLYCEEIYTQIDNHNFESPITEDNWGPLPNGMKVVTDKGDENRNTESKVLLIDGDILGGSSYAKMLPIKSNTGYVLALWIKAEEESDVSIGVYGSASGRNFPKLYTTKTGEMEFLRDGKWHRVNIVFGSGKFDECFFTVSGSKGKVWVDNIDLFTTTQGLTKDPNVVTINNVKPVDSKPVSFEKVPVTTESTVNDTEYVKRSHLSTWVETTEEVLYTEPEVAVKLKKSVVKLGGGINAGGIICIVAAAVLLASTAMFIILLIKGRKKKKEV